MPTHPLSFEKADKDLCFNRIDKKYRMPESNLHFPKADTSKYINSWESGIRCAVMQGGQGDTKHWAFNDPVKRKVNIKMLLHHLKNSENLPPGWLIFIL